MRPQVARPPERARAMRTLVIALLMVDRPHVRLQMARCAKCAPAMRALVVSAFLVDGAHVASASTLAAERLPAMLAHAIAARVRMRSWTGLFAGLAHGGGRAFKCQQRSPCLPQRVVMVGWGEIQMIAFAPKQRRSLCMHFVGVGAPTGTLFLHIRHNARIFYSCFPLVLVPPPVTIRPSARVSEA